MRSIFLSSRQGKKELSDNVQELRALLAAMQLDIIPVKVRITIIMEGLRTEVGSTEVFRVHTSTSEEVVDIALNAKFNSESYLYGTYGHDKNSFERSEPKDLSHVDGEEAELIAITAT